MNASDVHNQDFLDVLSRFRIQRGLAFGIIIIAALLAFELFNYSTTDFALSDLLGDLSFMGVRWATILAIAFCGIDFAGIARLFTPEEGSDDVKDVWYLFGAWLLAATMNAMLTWWGVSLAILNHNSPGNAVIPRETLLRSVPIFVAVLVWFIRVLIIGTFSVAGDRLFSMANPRPATSYRRRSEAQATERYPRNQSAPRSAPASLRPAPKSNLIDDRYNRPEPTYQPASLSASARREANMSDVVRR